MWHGIVIWWCWRRAGDRTCHDHLFLCGWKTPRILNLFMLAASSFLINIRDGAVALHESEPDAASRTPAACFLTRGGCFSLRRDLVWQLHFSHSHCRREPRWCFTEPSLGISLTTVKSASSLREPPRSAYSDARPRQTPLRRSPTHASGWRQP